MSPLAPASYLALGIAVVLGFIVFRNSVVFIFRWNINVPAFVTQIQKLIMANNIDRAIKLCNTEPHALLPHAIKALLTRANRPYSLYLTQEEVLLEVRARTALSRSFNKWVGIGCLLVIGSTWFAFAPMVEEASAMSQMVFRGALVVAAIAAFLAVANTARLNAHLVAIEAMTVKVRNLLYNRSGYKPPQYEPVELTAEEVERWRKGMDYVEEEAQKAGPGTAADLHDSQVDKKTGVLPPL